MQYQEKLDQLEKHFEHLTNQMADPVLISDGPEYRKVAKAHSDLSEVISKYRLRLDAGTRYRQRR